MRVLLVGDTHGNVSWLRGAVLPTADATAVDLVVQVGDFGWWPRVQTNDAFLKAARDSTVPVWWVDGNHEDHDELGVAVAAAGGPDEDGTVALGGNLAYVPRGSRLDWDGVSVVACGGAHSIDRRARTEGITWFEAEHVNDDDITRSTAGGHADLLLTHDAPAGWPIPGVSDEGLPRLWEVELDACHAHRRRLAAIMDAVTPGLVVHGHYHSAYRRTLDTGWGSVDIVGLSQDGTGGSLALLECEAGAWTIEPVPIDS